LSRNKNFKDAKVSFAFAFPDKYEIGISNLGQRVLYGIINDHPDFVADRIYAPDMDFKENLIASKKDFYALESKTPLKDFDLIGFSLQYELSYPTVLAMMELAQIPHRSENRTESDPIILAGGPCAYNPLPIADFIDGFLIGDGEEVVLEVCELIKSAKEKNLTRAEKITALSKIEGVFIPQIHLKTPDKKIKKGLVQLSYENAQKSYPIPFSSSVHDRAIVEIRRGCGRMCRFCQPGHVNLPVRERKAEDIIKIAKELVQSTGYDEYSLLSLSSNDYSNIKEVIKELGEDFNDKKISVSLPSQRIDGFNLELANLVQSVRKSTMTLAPEAGSQRLRDVIRKNISEKQILDAALTLYENGWSKIKFYFIVGLPTETMADVDEMATLLEKIKFQSTQIKREKGLKHSLDLTCTLSIFVPKPFTPFQWAGQLNSNELRERIHYLKDKTKHIKGLKINYHDRFVSQIEAVLTRGGATLCDYIEKLWQKGCYLDAWSENFNKYVWADCAEAVGISLKELAEKSYGIEETLPWDFIDIGVEKSWLITEYEDALKNITKPSCETGCVKCGVCGNFKTQKVMDEPYRAQITAGSEPTLQPLNPSTDAVPPTYKYRLKLSKTGILRYFSHLDWQNTFLKALARTGLNVAYSHGFNPSMKVSLGVALPLFLESAGELADIEILQPALIKLTGNELGEFKIEADLRQTAINYYKTNIQGKKIKHPALGEILFTNLGIKKTRAASADLRKLKSMPTLIDLIATAEFEGSADIYKPRKDNFNKFYYLKNKIFIGETMFEHRIIIGENDFGKRYYDINDIKIGSLALTQLQNRGANKPNCIIPKSKEEFNPYCDLEIQDLKLKLEKAVPVGCEIMSIVKIDKSAKSIDVTAHWAEYRVRLFDKGLQKFDSLVYNMDKVLSSEEILLTKKNKKGLIKKINVKPSIKSYRFEDENLFIILKTGQSEQRAKRLAGLQAVEDSFNVSVKGEEIPALRADDLMKIVDQDVLFDIKRLRFFDEEMNEI